MEQGANIGQKRMCWTNLDTANYMKTNSVISLQTNKSIEITYDEIYSSKGEFILFEFQVISESLKKDVILDSDQNV